MFRFKAEGYHVISLTQSSGSEINPFLQANGIEAHSFPIKRKADFIYYCQHLVHFILFCKKHNVSFVFSHLDSANFVASIGQYFIKASVFLCRHHIDEAELYNYHTNWTYRLTNLLSKKIIVVSQHSMRYMVQFEKVPVDKVIHINLAYDFSLYKRPEEAQVKDLKQKFGNCLLLVMVCRLTRFKRPELAIQVLEKLKEGYLDAKLIILGTGEMLEELGHYITKRNLEESVFLKGHVNNAIDYIAAADFLIHPSILESSCVVIKEAGIVQKPVIVCRHIGDFDDYLVDGYNGFLVDKNRFVAEAVHLITTYRHDINMLEMIGKRLSLDIQRLFDITTVFPQYRKLLSGNKRGVSDLEN